MEGQICLISSHGRVARQLLSSMIRMFIINEDYLIRCYLVEIGDEDPGGDM